MVCANRQLTQAQLEAGYDQQRTGVMRAIRPFSGTPTIENLIDYLNRELCPAVQSSRAKVNEVFKQVADNAPSANPLAYYFSTTTTNADPTVGRMRLNQATQNTATVLRVSQSNGRLQDVTPWLDVMSGGPTSPLGVLTMVDAINPGRFLRFDLNTMVDQGAYWDLGVTIVESSDASPFVDDEPVVIGFIAGVSAAGSTIPVAALSPIANDTFVGNVSGGTAAPSAVNLSTLAGAGLNFAAHTLDVNGSTSITVTGDQVTRAALTGEVTATANANATTVTRSTNFQSSPWTGDHEFDGQVRLGTVTSSASTGSINVTLGASSTRVLLSGTGTITLGTVSGCADGRVLVLEFSGTGEHTITHDASSVDAFSCPGNVDLIINGRGAVFAVGRLGGQNNWKIIGVSNDLTTHANTWTAANTYSSTISMGQKVLFAGTISPTAISADQNDYTPTGWSTANLVRLSTNSATARTLTGAAAGSSGELKWLVNLGPGTISLDAASTSSTAANRWLHVSGTTFTISVNGVCGILYDGTSSRWRPVYPNLII